MRGNKLAMSAIPLTRGGNRGCGVRQTLSVWMRNVERPNSIIEPMVGVPPHQLIELADIEPAIAIADALNETVILQMAVANCAFCERSRARLIGVGHGNETTAEFFFHAVILL